MTDLAVHVLLVTGPAAPAAAVVPVLAALEAAELRVRAIDAGGSDGAVEKVLRALRGEDRRLLRELETNPPDVVVAFDAETTISLTAARDQAANPSPVIAVVAELLPGKAWGATDADRYLAVDDDAAVALVDAGVEGDRILVTGPFGEHGFAAAGLAAEGELRQRFKIGGSPVVLLEVAGFGAELAGQLALQLSLIGGGEGASYLFDAGSDGDAAAVLRRQVPALGLKGKLFGPTADVPLLWRAADLVVARPRPRALARTQLLGRRWIAFAPEAEAEHALAKIAETRKLALIAATPLMLSGAIEQALKQLRAPAPAPDGAAAAAAIAWVVGRERRAVLEERRSQERAATGARVRDVTRAAEAAARAAAPPGEIEDLGGDDGPGVSAAPALDRDEIERLRRQLRERKDQVTRAMLDARGAAEEQDRRAAAARGQSDAGGAAEAERRADAERARMHAQLGEIGRLDEELAALERAAQLAAEVPPGFVGTAGGAAAAAATAAAPGAAGPRPAADPSGARTAPGATRPRPSSTDLDAELARLKKQSAGAAPPPGRAGGTGASGPTSGGAGAAASSGSRTKARSDVDDELQRLKRQMEGKMEGKAQSPASKPSPPPGTKKP